MAKVLAAKATAAKITKGTGNVFADIGLPDAETHLLKAELVRRIGLIIDLSPITQAEAAQRMGMTQPDVSKMLRGGYRPISLEKLMQCLVALGQNVTITIAKPTAVRKGPSIKVAEPRSTSRQPTLFFHSA
jgi:predicted XRE-type DNA-binding protein